jgi:predicted TIM-barrel fold metal-dependent hydrolase
MADFKLISADSHITEPPAAWERAQKEYGERAPREVRDPPGLPKGLWLITEGLPPMLGSHENTGTVIGKERSGSAVSSWGMSAEAWKHLEPGRFTETFRHEDYLGGWDPAARLQDQDQDGVEAEVHFASLARNFYGLTDAPFQRAILRSYNAWLHEFCSYNPKRLIGLAVLSILDIEHAVADIQEYAKLGFRGVVIPTRIKDSGYYEPRFEPLWATAEEAGVVINVHTGSTQGVARTNFGGTRKEDPWTLPMGFAPQQLPAQQFLGQLVVTGVFDRYPNLKVVCAEFDVGWVANLVQQVDNWFGRTTVYDGSKSLNKLPPSEYFKRNIFFTFQDDRAGVLTTPVYGENNFLWASDYPHKVTTWPYSHRTVDANFAGLDPQVKRQVVRENTNKLYDLGL